MKCYVTIEGPTSSESLVSEETEPVIQGEFIDEEPIGNELTGVVVGFDAGDVTVTMSVSSDEDVTTKVNELLASGYEAIPQVG